jgi:hypothetical protein
LNQPNAFVSIIPEILPEFVFKKTISYVFSTDKITIFIVDIYF